MDHQDLTEHTLHTRQDQVSGTPVDPHEASNRPEGVTGWRAEL